MKLWITPALIITLLLFPTHLTSQESPIKGYLDIPAVGQPISSNHAVFAGWITNCKTGQQPHGFTLYYTYNNVLVRVPVTMYWALYRPDVYNAIKNSCQWASPYVGFTAIAAQPIPTGSRNIILEWVDGTGVRYWTPLIQVQ